MLHSLSVAVSLAASRPDLQVDVAATDFAVLRRARDIVEALGPSRINWRLLGPGWLRAIRMPEGGPPKLPMLVANARRLAAYDVIVAPERTTAALRKLGVKSKLVYTQHGAGDREGPFEARLGAFDLVFAAGRKQYECMIQEGLVAPENCAIVGYPKFDLVDALKPDLPRLFAEQRPTVLYNPHFHSGLSSWPDWGRQVLDAFAGQTRYNLIFAPHLRLFGSRPPGEVPGLAAYLGNPAIHMDLGGSAAAIDMTYLRMADVYLGDVSSQIYEFLREPRPCVLLNPGHTDWRGDPSYGHWRFGLVVEDIHQLLPTIAAAQTGHPQFRPVQVAGFNETFEIQAEPASSRAARAIAGLLGPSPVAEPIYDAAVA